MDPDETMDREATTWFARMRSDHVDAEDRARFSRWLAADADHALAYAEHQALWDDLEIVATSEAVLRMREEAVGRVRRPSWRQLAAIAASVIVVGLAALWAVPRLTGPELYRTGVGERSTITLADGSVVELNTDTVLEVRYTEDRRGLRLVRGQALFEVAHNPDRPFVVEARDQRVTALGTAFDVRVAGRETRVTLIEGTVAVERRVADAVEHRRLTAGEALVAAPREPSVVETADLREATSWRTGQIIFHDDPLGEVVEEVNRYSTRKVVFGDPQLSDLRVSGAIRTGSVDRFVAALEVGFPVTGELDEARNVIVLHPR